MPYMECLGMGSGASQDHSSKAANEKSANLRALSTREL